MRAPREDDLDKHLTNPKIEPKGYVLISSQKLKFLTKPKHQNEIGFQ